MKNKAKENAKVEIMAPAGDYDSLMAAIKAGADSVYFGVEQLNMRRHGAKNFSLDDLKKIVGICKENKVKSYLTVNSIIYDSDIENMKKIIDSSKEAEIDAIIACDIAAIEYAASIGQKVHSSTQLNVSNIEAVKFYAKYADVIVLARELTLPQIKEICDEVKKQEIKGPGGELVKIEIFIHGALCVSISGKCYMSLASDNHSANRGECFQTCRRAYRVVDDETGNEFVIDNKYVMSPRDLCTIGYIDKIIESGVSVLKIEGRARSADYVYTVTKAYKEAVESCLEGNYNEDKVKTWLKELESVFNRGFWQGGYYLGEKNDAWANCKGSKSTTEKILIGKINHYFSNKKIAILDVTSHGIQKGDSILITGPTTGIVNEEVVEVFKDGKPFDGLAKGNDITIPVKEKVRGNDKVFLVRKIG